jgi:Rrf2 family protein
MPSTALKFSEAFVLALHSVVIIAKNGDSKTSVQVIAEELRASVAHLQKVMQRLVKANLIKSSRGPKGGYLLVAKPESLHLIEVYEAIEGKLVLCNCLFSSPVCDGKSCILGSLTSSVNKQVWDYLTNKTVKDVL